jgi:prepilin peptidase CpaA
LFSTEQELASIVTSLVLLAILVLAVRQDLVERRISNILTFGALAAALAILSLAQGFDGLIHALTGAGVGLLCLLPLYLCKGMGAGDVKLMTAGGAFLGPFNAFAAALLSLAFGAVLAIVVVVWRVVEMRAATAGAGAGAGSAVGIRSALSHAGKERFPYAVAIALGVISTMWIRGMLEPLIRSFT